MQLRSFEEADVLTTDLVLQIKRILSDAIAQRGHAYLVVSGGKTPVELFKSLARAHIPWEHVTITLADERCVPMDDDSRNERLVKQYLLQHEARQATFVHLYHEGNQDLTPIEQAIGSLPTFDVVILGMGEDGHTASLFPCADELSAGLDSNAAAVLWVHPKTAPHVRVSLSKRRLLDSRVIFFHLIGQNKLTVLHQAMAQHDPMIMPACAFLNDHHANVQVMYAP